MEMRVLLLVIFCGLVAGKEYSVTLDPADKFNVSWSFEETTPSSYITFTIRCMTTGWVGLGFSPNGGMANADIVMAWVLDDGSATILDMYATANQAPVKDDSQDVTLVSATESNGVTTIVFKRKLNTCDKEKDNIITSSTTRLIYAYQDSDPDDNSPPSSTNYHGSNRGSRSLYLLESKSVSSSPPADALTLDMKIELYSVPATDTTYYCKFFEPPQLDSKHHVISIEALVQEGNEALIHHIVAYGCWGVEQEHLRNNNKTEGVCYTAEMPEFFESCKSIMYAWAVGGGTFNYPEEAGFPIGGMDGTAPDYYMLEVHYDNPSMLDDWVDSSGLRFVYTPTLRSMDVGLVTIGSILGIVVPPQPDKFRVTSYCDSSCTKQWIPDSGVELFSYFLHAHLLGVAIQVDWYREGKHIGILADDDSYDFNFQESRHFETNKKMMPGDTLKITCTYTDAARNTVTYGGFSSSEEMCLAFISYYPMQNVSDCVSTANLVFDPSDPVYSALSVNATGSRGNGGYANFKVLSDVTEWTENGIAALLTAYEDSTHYSNCSGYEGVFEVNHQPINAAAHPYKEKEKVNNFCENQNDGKDDGDKEIEDGNGSAPSSTTPSLLVVFLFSFIKLAQ